MLLLFIEEDDVLDFPNWEIEIVVKLETSLRGTGCKATSNSER